MKTPSFNFALTLFIILGSSIGVYAQISGPTAATVNVTYQYSYSSSQYLGGGGFYPSGGTVTSQWNNWSGYEGPVTYYANIQWTVTGERNLQFANYSEVLATLQVDVCSSGQSAAVAISNPGTICQGSNVTLTATPTNGGGSPYYVWKVNGVTKQSSGSGSYTSNLLVNNDVVSVTLTSSISCLSPATATASRTISGISPTAVSVSINNPGTVCQGTQITFTASPTNGGSSPTYEWYRNGYWAEGNVYSTNGNQYSPDASHPFLNGETMQVKITSNAACYTGSLVQWSNIVTISVQSNTQPSVTIIGSPAFCEGTPQTYSATSSQSITWYSWSYNTGEQGTRTSTSSSFALSGADLQSPGSTVQLTVGVSGTCLTSNTASGSLPLTIDDPPQVGTLSASGSMFCSSGSVTLSLTSHTGNNSWKYRYKDGVNGTFTPFSQFSVSSSNSVNFTSLSCTSTLARYYEFKTEVSNGSCSIVTSNTVPVTVYPPPSVGTLTLTNGPDFCSSGTLNLNLSSYVGVLQWEYQEMDAGGSWSQWATFSTNSANTNSFPVTNNGSVPRYYRFKVVALHGNCLGAETQPPYVTASSVPIPSLPSPSTIGRTEPGVVTIEGWKGANATTNRWYAAQSGGTALETAEIYSPSISATTVYWVTSFNETVPSCESQRVPITAHVYPATPLVSPTMATVNMGAPPTTLSVTNGPYTTYQWWFNGNVIGTNSSVIVTTPGKYKIEGTKTGMTGSKFSADVTIDRLFDSQSPRHYVIVNNVRANNVTDPTQVDGLSVDQRSRTVTYIGGLGNTLQSIVSQASPAKKDIIQAPSYDALGRQLVQYLPYISTGDDSKFRDKALDSLGYTNSQQYKFYQKTNIKIAPDTKPYSTTLVEPSPLQRPTAQTGVGNSWYALGKQVTTQYLLNRATNNIRLWKVVSGLPTSTIAYADYQLYVLVTTDENGNQVKIYTDKNGREVQKEVQSGATTWLKTSYIYDDFGRLTFVLTPEGVRTLSGYSPTQPFLDSWAFQYKYDNYGRVVETKPPAAGWQYTVYDQLDRVVMTQSADQRTRNEWTFVKYDVFGRKVVVGYKAITASRATIQASADTQSYNHEIISADATGYTLNRTYPSATASDLLSVSYYDNYDFLGYSGWDAEAHSFSFVSELGNTSTAPIVTGMPTGSKIRVVKGQTPSSQWLNAVQYYDAELRPVQVISENHFNGLDRSTNSYNNLRYLVENKFSHRDGAVILHRKMTYDHAGRPKTVSQIINPNTYLEEEVQWTNLQQTIVNGNTISKSTGDASWGNSGAFSVNSLSDNTNGWVEFSVTNAVTVALIGLSDNDINANYTTIDFAIHPEFNSKLYIFEGGVNIGQFGTYAVGDVFRIERQDGVIYYKKNGVTLYTSANSFIGTLYADCAFYNNTGGIANTRMAKSSKEIILGSYEYNELGQLIDKKLHNTTGNNFLQSIDYRYNIRGWLASINNAQLASDGGISNDDTGDYFGMEMLFNTVESGLANTAMYNGNISAIKYKGIGSVTGSTDRQSYKLTYDKADRLQTSTSQVYSGSTWTKEPNVKNESMTYDDNGNIKTLLRNQPKHQLVGINASYISESIDNLTFTYKPSSGNQLDKVEDATGKAEGFSNVASPGTEFTYTADGSVSADNNKGIDTIHYNMLGKPWQIVFTDGRMLEYAYSASGQKLKLKFYQGSTLQDSTDYSGGFVYKMGTLDFFGSPEGRVVKKGSSYEYQYAIADHQGNTRVLFSAGAPTVEQSDTDFESDPGDIENFPTGGGLSNLSLFNNTPGGTNSQLLNGGYNGQVGVGKSFAVLPGDTVRIKASVKYEGSNSSSGGAFASALLSAFGLPAPAPGELGTASAAMNTWGAMVDGGYLVEQNSGAPAAHVNIVIFDKNYNFLDAAYEQVSTAAEQVGVSPDVDHEDLVKEYIIEREGFVFMYVSNNSPVNVYFDDVVMTDSASNVIQYNEYYPFGLQTASSWTRQDASNRYLYNGGNELNENSGWYETFFREYDAALGRFMQVDPLAGSFASHSPYHYAYNNPLLFNDVLGDSANIGSGFDGRIGPGSGNHWSNQYNSVAANYMIMGTGAFLSFYGISDGQGGTNYQNASNVAYGLAVGGFGTVIARGSDGKWAPLSRQNGRLGHWELYSYTDNNETYTNNGQQYVGVPVIGAKFVSRYPTWTHNAIIKAAFAGMLTEAQIEAIMEGSEYADSRQFQTPEYSYMHAMTGSNYVIDGDVAAAKQTSQRLMNGYVYEKGSDFNRLMQNGNEKQAFFALGMGMHPLMDQFSPAHSGLQVWNPGFSNTWGLTHFLVEASTHEGVPAAIEVIQNYYEYWK